MKLSLAVLILACALPAAAQTASKASSEYPLEARVIAVEKHTSPYHDSSHTGASTYEWHLMKIIIGNKLYGMTVSEGPFMKHSWLEIGTYPARKAKDGIEVQFLDDHGKLQHEVLLIKSEEPIPAK